MTKISIIVPIYNVEKYLKRCIDSIRKQTLEDIEIILINDGSKDNSLAICKEYQSLDERIILINQSNKGVSAARNAGIQVAKGEYIGFVDPDDWVDSNMYKSLYVQAKKINADVCMCNYRIEKINSSLPIEINIDKNILEGEEISKKIVADMIGASSLNSRSKTIMGSVWRLIVKRELLKQNNISFNTEIPLMEDLLFCIDILLKSNRVGINKNTFYHYFHNTLSATNTYRKNMLELQLKVFYEIEKMLQKSIFYPYFLNRLNARYVNIFLIAIANEVKKENEKSLKEKILYIKKICKDSKLKRILKRENMKDYTLRKKLVLKAMKKELAPLLFLYYFALQRYTNYFNKSY